MEGSGAVVGSAGVDDKGLGLAGADAVVARDGRVGEAAAAASGGGAGVAVVVGDWVGGSTADVVEGNCTVVRVAKEGEEVCVFARVWECRAWE